VVVAGRKLVGSAMRRVGDAILQHGSILEGWDGALQAGCLGLPDDSGLRPSVVTLTDVLGTAPEPAALTGAVADAFAATFGVVLEPSPLTRDEWARAALLER